MSALPPNRPLGVRLLNGIGAATRIAGVRWPSLDQDRLLAAARRQTGLKRFGEPAFREGLERLLDSLEREAQLSTLGRFVAREDILGYLTNRLRVLDYRRRHPEVADRRITRPLFILGLPRTGTTVLFNLLAQDPANRAPLGWEVEMPCPPPE
ncbi:MAG: sulfotransferase, partial [Deltaproteobacteria bacterium]